jgi:hypothetical protein
MWVFSAHIKECQNRLQTSTPPPPPPSLQHYSGLNCTTTHLSFIATLLWFGLLWAVNAASGVFYSVAIAKKALPPPNLANLASIHQIIQQPTNHLQKERLARAILDEPVCCT